MLVFFALHVPVNRRDVVAWEHARLAVTSALPPVGVRVVQDLNEVAASEAELSLLLWVEVEQGLHVCGVLHKIKVTFLKHSSELSYVHIFKKYNKYNNE